MSQDAHPADGLTGSSLQADEAAADTRLLGLDIEAARAQPAPPVGHHGFPGRLGLGAERSSALLRKGSTMARALTADRLRALLDYDPETGVFKWLEHRGRVKAGDVAGTLDHGTIAIRINRRRYRACHLAVLWMTGKLPEGEINHRDGDGTNNRWANLRPIGRSEKLYNRGKQRNNSIGFKGVTFHKGRGRFLAQIQAAGDSRHLGYFNTAEEAQALIAKRRVVCTASTRAQADAGSADTPPRCLCGATA